MTTRRTWTRRAVLGAGAGLGLAAAGTAWLLRPGQGAAAFATVDQAHRTLDALAAGGARTASGWDLPKVLHHAAQSIEYSMQGFPQLKSELFRKSVGPAAFGVFDAFGSMRHSLTEPIPGAPDIAAGQTIEPAVMRLSQALRSFEAHAGPLMPHFAYGALDKPNYLRAHLLHLANHWELVVAG